MKLVLITKNADFFNRIENVALHMTMIRQKSEQKSRRKLYVIESFDEVNYILTMW